MWLDPVPRHRSLKELLTSLREELPTETVPYSSTGLSENTGL
jgi:hypothetical protein